PALYLFFRNKADIFRAIVKDLLKQSHMKARAVLEGEGELTARMGMALDAALYELLHLVEGSPHGRELIDFNHQVGADLTGEWRETMIADFAQAIAREAALRGVLLEDRGFTAADLSRMIFDILEGSEAERACGRPAIERARLFLRLVELALEA